MLGCELEHAVAGASDRLADAEQFTFVGVRAGHELAVLGAVQRRATGAEPERAGAQRFLADLNQLYRSHPAFWEADYDVEGFQWVDCSDNLHSVFSFLRRTKDGGQQILVVLHLTPELRTNYRLGLPTGGYWRELLNSDAAIYGGSNQGNLGGVQAEEIELHGQPFSAEFTLPPLSVVVFVA